MLKLVKSNKCLTNLVIKIDNSLPQTSITISKNHQKQVSVWEKEYISANSKTETKYMSNINFYTTWLAFVVVFNIQKYFSTMVY